MEMSCGTSSTLFFLCLNKRCFLSLLRSLFASQGLVSRFHHLKSLIWFSMEKLFGRFLHFRLLAASKDEVQLAMKAARGQLLQVFYHTGCNTESNNQGN